MKQQKNQTYLDISRTLYPNKPQHTHSFQVQRDHSLGWTHTIAQNKTQQIYEDRNYFKHLFWPQLHETRNQPQENKERKITWKLNNMLLMLFVRSDPGGHDGLPLLSLPTPRRSLREESSQIPGTIHSTLHRVPPWAAPPLPRRWGKSLPHNRGSLPDPGDQ